MSAFYNEIEQVSGGAGRAWLDLVSNDLESRRYAVAAADLSSAGVGAPNIRQRLYWLAYADSQHAGRRVCGPRESVEAGEGAARERVAGLCAFGGMGNASGAGCEGRKCETETVEGRKAGRSVTEPSGPLDPWRGLEWIDCLDGKARPTQPGLFPLAARHPGDVGRLRAYGNAINAKVAQTFVEAAMVCRP
ncbi:MAG: hypothetical protein PHZ23_14595 [Acidiphilium sp.]|nr:hypothetical protein [Acidiphilium sp.]